MENQHKQIKGYRDLNEDEIKVMNLIKEEGLDLKDLIEHVRTKQGLEADPRWISIAETHLQQGIMALVRAVAKPEGF